MLRFSAAFSSWQSISGSNSPESSCPAGTTQTRLLLSKQEWLLRAPLSPCKTSTQFSMLCQMSCRTNWPQFSTGLKLTTLEESIRGNGRRATIFPPEMWDVYKRVLNYQGWMNNHAEAAPSTRSGGTGNGPSNNLEAHQWPAKSPERKGFVPWEFGCRPPTSPEKEVQNRDCDNHIRIVISD